MIREGSCLISSEAFSPLWSANSLALVIKPEPTKAVFGGIRPKVGGIWPLLPGPRDARLRCTLGGVSRGSTGYSRDHTSGNLLFGGSRRDHSYLESGQHYNAGFSHTCYHADCVCVFVTYCRIGFLSIHRSTSFVSASKRSKTPGFFASESAWQSKLDEQQTSRIWKSPLLVGPSGTD
jgi:hypothetical protein